MEEVVRFSLLTPKKRLTWHIRTNIAASPSVGVFIAKKLGTGLRFTYSSMKQEVPEFTYKNRDYEYSPFARYYILSDKKPYNIITEVAYDLWVSTSRNSNGSKNRQTGGGYTASAGPVIFFSPQVALEWMMGYKSGKASAKTYVIFSSIGFQWHFEK